MERKSTTRNLQPAVLLLAAALSSTTAYSDGSSCKQGPLSDSSQVLLSIAGGWGSNDALLARFDRPSNDVNWKSVNWSADSQAVPAVIGRSGLGWSNGDQPAQFDSSKTEFNIHQCTKDSTGACNDNIKREGDGKAPAGIFDLGPATGYGDAASEGLLAKGGLDYTQANPNIRCVDHPSSKYYNQIVDVTQIQQPYDFCAEHDDCPSADEGGLGDSVEEMDRRSLKKSQSVYNHVIQVMNYTRGASPTPMGGSCIFLHELKAADPATGLVGTTSGCTSMDPQRMQDLFGWLQPALHPKLVQLTMNDYVKHQKDWCLPEIDSAKWEAQLYAADCNREIKSGKTVDPQCNGIVPDVLSGINACGQQGVIPDRSTREP